MKRVRAIPAIAVAVFISAGALAQTDFGFMPDGGKETLADLVEVGAFRFGDLRQREASEEEWRAAIRDANPSLDDEATETLASYLAINLPMQGATSVDELPPDGKELAIENCQFCHSFFTGYLAHDRDTEGWRAIFKSPFHTELPMSEAERETFSRYSAINMPIPYEQVPEDLRF